MQKILTENDSNVFQIIYTKPLLKASTLDYRKELEYKLRKSMLFFPELNPKIVKFGLRTGVTAIAHTDKFKENQDFILIGINPAEIIYYYVLGHELTHFVQKIIDIPAGEKQCDVWTIIRNKLFTDRHPHYIKMPVAIIKNWDGNKNEVRKLCIRAIEERKGNRRYIMWLETELLKNISEDF